jgi:putative nucleotidyltransferase with HDIG domain
LPGTSNKEATVMLERIRNKTANSKYKFGHISISFGYETKVDSNQNLNEIFLQAEELMYSNKMDMSDSVRGETIGIILKTLFEKSTEVKLHTERVSKYAEMIAVAMGLPKAKVLDIKTIGNLHDIGKIVIDLSIIDKPGKLTEKEYEIIKQHPVSGARMLASSHEYNRLSAGVLHHHERYDGKGYPNKLVGENIPLESRIISVADAYDAMTSERSYKDKLTKEEAIAELIMHSGTQFDKIVVEAFVTSVAKAI